MTSRISWLTANYLLAFVLSLVLFPSTALAQEDNVGFVLGRIFEIDKEKYNEKKADEDDAEDSEGRDGADREDGAGDENGEDGGNGEDRQGSGDGGGDGDGRDGADAEDGARGEDKQDNGDGDAGGEAKEVADAGDAKASVSEGADNNALYAPVPDYLKPRSDVEVVARLLRDNKEFRSESTGGDGDYVISKLSPGVLEFTLRYEDKDYPVAQRLGAQVNLAFVAELCFVLDKEEEEAWMIVAGPRRSPDVPSWVPKQCQSQLGACLGMVTGNDSFRDGLVLIFAGAGAAATGIGITATRENAASPVEQ